MPKQFLQSVYANYADTSPGGAGTVLPDGSIDPAGIGAYIDAGQLIVPTAEWNTGGWVIRPAAENCTEQRSLIRFKLNAGDIGIPVVLLRANQANATAYHAAASSSFLHIDSMPSTGSVSTIVQDTSVSITAGSYYWLDFRVRTVGSATQTTALLLADSTVNGSPAPGAPISTITTTDSSSALQSAAGPFQFALANTNNVDPLIVTHWYTWNTLRGILVIGDSRMANTPTGGSQTPAQAMQAAIQAMVPLESCQVLNAAIGGTATGDWLTTGSNFQNALSAAIAAGCTEALIDLFVNDAATSLASSPATVVSNLADTAGGLVSAGIRTFLSQPYGVTPGSDSGAFTVASNALIAQYAAAIPALFNGSTILPGQQTLANWWPDNCNSTTSNDGLHPAAAQVPFLGEIHARPLAEAFSSSQTATVVLNAQGFTPTRAAKLDNLPSAAAAAPGGLLTVGAGPGQIQPNGNGSVPTTGASGSGAFAVTINIANTGAPITGAAVRISGAQSAGAILTDTTGNAAFSLNAGTVTVTIAAPGYVGLSAAHTIDAAGQWDATGSPELSLILTAAGASLSPGAGQTTAYLTTRDGQGDPVAGVTLTFSLVDPQADVDSFDFATFTATSDSTGLLQILLRQSTTYQARLPAGNWTTFTTGSAASFALPEILGNYTD